MRIHIFSKCLRAGHVSETADECTRVHVSQVRKLKEEGVEDWQEQMRPKEGTDYWRVGED